MDDDVEFAVTRPTQLSCKGSITNIALAHAQQFLTLDNIVKENAGLILV